MQDNDVRVVMKKRVPQYYNKQQQLELVLAVQQLFESGEHDLISTESDEEDECGTCTGHRDIWEDVTCMDLLRGGMLLDTV